MIASLKDVFWVTAMIGGLGLFFLVYSLRVIIQMIAAGFNQTQENIDCLAGLMLVKRSMRKPINQKRFTATEAYVRAGSTLFINTGIVIGCMGALLSVFG